MPTLNRWISLNELCSYLGVSRETAIKWVSQKVMEDPFVRNR